MPAARGCGRGGRRTARRRGRARPRARAPRAGGPAPGPSALLPRQRGGLRCGADDPRVDGAGGVRAWSCVQGGGRENWTGGEARAPAAQPRCGSRRPQGLGQRRGPQAGRRGRDLYLRVFRRPSE